MKTSLYLFLLLLFTAQFAHAQDHRTIRGKIYDAGSKEPLAFAHVGIPEKGIGTTSSESGLFVLKIPNEYLNSTLMVSFIGYKTYRKPVSEVSSPIRIYIEQTVSQLNEVVVMGDAAVEDIIRKAVRNIPQNYPTHPTTVLGFYRESRTDDSLNYTYLAEGVLNIYKNSYNSKKEGQVSLVQGRMINLKNPLDTVVRSNFSSGHMAAHRFDFVKNREDFINEKYFPVYKYWIESMTTYNDRPVYIIGFGEDPDGGTIETEDDSNSDLGGILGGLFSKKRVVREGARMQGKIFIEQGSYAFIRAEFEITEEGLEKYNDYPLYAGSWKGNAYVVNYRPLGDKWYFSDALREGLYGGGGTYNNEIKVTQINTEKSKPLPYKDRLSRGQRFTKVTGSYDPDFWSSYNIVPMTAALEESMIQLENQKKALEVFDPEYLAQLQQQRDSIYKVELLKEIESRAAIEGIEPEEVVLNMGEPGIVKRKKRFTKFKFLMGLGTHLIPTEAGLMGYTYLTDDKDTPSTILSIEENMKSRDFEITGNWDMEFYFSKNFYARFSWNHDFYNSIYKNRALGVGAQLNLTKQRPVFLKVTAQYDNLRYARKIGQVDNDFGKFKFDGKKYKSERINVYYGSRTLNLRLSADLSVELHPGREFFVRAAYYLPFARRQDIWLWERREIFKRKRQNPLSNERSLLTQNGEPFSGAIYPEETLKISVGFVFK